MRAVTVVLLAVAAVAAGGARADTTAWPIDIGETLDAVLARLGAAVSFGADCGSWRGPSVETRITWHEAELRVMGLLRGKRIAGLRLERPPVVHATGPQCRADLDAFAAEWTAEGYAAAPDTQSGYDGPIQRWTRTAVRSGAATGRFEAEYRASREECRWALVLEPTVLPVGS